MAEKVFKLLYEICLLSSCCFHTTGNEPIKILLTMKNRIVLSESHSRLAADQIAKFIVPDWRDKVDLGTTSLSRSHQSSPVEDYESGLERKKN